MLGDHLFQIATKPAERTVPAPRGRIRPLACCSMGIPLSPVPTNSCGALHKND